MSNKKKLAYAIAKYLRSEIKSDSQEDESLEVAVQCLENAFGISADDNTLDIGISLPSVFDAVVAKIESERPALSEEAKAEAEKWKNLGNEKMKEEKYQEAIDHYTKAINIDPRNPVYYCNRAAAHSYIKNHQAVIDDSQIAIGIEPTYSKAYGRLGLAYTHLENYEEAKKTYLKALEFEPDNEVYKRNLVLNSELEKQKAAGAATGGGQPPINMDNITSMLGNQHLMAMASQLLSNPNMQSMFDNLISGNATPGGGSMDGLLQAGQRLAQMMQSSNPELVEQLRQQVRGNNQPPDPQN